MTESMPANDVIITNNVGESAMEAVTAQKTSIASAEIGGNRPPTNPERKKKKSGAFAIFRAALSMLRKRPGEKKAKKTISKQKSTTASNGGGWAKLVGSMRPLSGLQDPAMSPPHQPSPATADDGETTPPQKQAPAAADGGAINDEETIQAQKEATAAEIAGETVSPASPAVSSSSRGTMSRYASAASLRDLYCSSDDEDDDEEEDPDEVFDAITGDEMIDAKAEEFIAQFYKQIQLQNTRITHHRGI